MKVDFYQGDCVEVTPTIDVVVDFILTDPPYDISNNNNASGISREYSGYTSNKGTWDEKMPAYEWILPVCSLLKDGGILACFGTFGSLVPVYLELEFLQMTFQSHITWHKTNPAPSIHRRMLTHSNEIILVYSKGSNWTFNYDVAKELNDGKQMHNHIEQGAVPKMFGVTRKPVPLCEKLIKIFTNDDDLVFDPFAGSGAILEAASKCGRRAIGIEKNLEIYNLAKQRLDTVST